MLVVMHIYFFQLVFLEVRHKCLIIAYWRKFIPNHLNSLGIGLGLIYLPAIVSVTCYFEKKRAFATGIAVCGSGFGTFLLTPFMEYLVND